MLNEHLYFVFSIKKHLCMPPNCCLIYSKMKKCGTVAWNQETPKEDNFRTGEDKFDQKLAAINKKCSLTQKSVPTINIILPSFETSYTKGI